MTMPVMLVTHLTAGRTWQIHALQSSGQVYSRLGEAQCDRPDALPHEGCASGDAAAALLLLARLCRDE